MFSTQHLSIDIDSCQLLAANWLFTAIYSGIARFPCDSMAFLFHLVLDVQCT